MSALPAAWPLEVLGIYFTIISILVVFQVLELQLWVESVNQYRSEFEKATGLAGRGNREARRRWREAAQRLGKGYPSLVALALYAVQLGLFALGLQLDLVWIREVPWLYTTVPWVGFLVLVIGGPLALVLRSRRSLDAILAGLDEMDG